jgi:hypothetical protein
MHFMGSPDVDVQRGMKNEPDLLSIYAFFVHFANIESRKDRAKKRRSAGVTQHPSQPEAVPQPQPAIHAFL